MSHRWEGDWVMGMWYASVDWSSDEFIAKCDVGKWSPVGRGESPENVAKKSPSLSPPLIPLSALLPRHKQISSPMFLCQASLPWTLSSRGETCMICEPRETFSPLNWGHQFLCSNDEQGTKTASFTQDSVFLSMNEWTWVSHQKILIYLFCLLGITGSMLKV